MNDVIETLYPESGSMLDNTDFFTQQMCINAYRKLQDFLVSLGYPRLRDRTILTNLTAYGSNDPSTQPYISWTGSVLAVIIAITAAPSAAVTLIPARWLLVIDPETSIPRSHAFPVDSMESKER